MNARQKKVLNLLLDKYENSRTYTGENQVRQTFVIRPEEVYPGYTSNYENLDQIHIFEDEMIDLENKNYISLEWKYQAITKIQLNTSQIQKTYESINRRQKNDTIHLYQEFYTANCVGDPIIQSFCKEQLLRLEQRKKSLYALNDAETIIKLLRIITENKQDILERELSITVFSDSKTFEKSWRSRICRILRKYGEFEDMLQDTDQTREAEMILLENYHIYANPSYVYFHGNGKITFQNGNKIILTSRYPLALSAASLAEVKEFSITDSVVLTIENLTSFNRMELTDTFMIYLAGYHNTIKQKVIKQIAEDNPNLIWSHFGDIDPDGYLILDRLSRETNLSISSYCMGIPQLKEYAKYCKELNENDRVKAQNLIAEGKHTEIMQYMLDHNCKLEQEIISWMER